MLIRKLLEYPTPFPAIFAGLGWGLATIGADGIVHGMGLVVFGAGLIAFSIAWAGRPR